MASSEAGPEAVFFSTVFTGKLAGDTDTHLHIPFDKILAQNPTGGWDTTSHQYTCQRAGPYMVTFTVRPDKDKMASVHLMQGEEIVVSLYVVHKKNWGAGTSSQMAIVQLEVNDTVWIRLDSGEEMGIRSHPMSPYATLNIFRLNP